MKILEKPYRKNMNIWIALLGIISLTAMVTTGLSKECNNRKLDIMLVIDGTSSLGYQHFDNIKIFLKNVLSKINIGPTGVHVGMIQFSDHWDTRIEKHLGDNNGADDVLSRLEKIRYTQGYYTLTGSAIRMARKQFFGSHSKARPGVDKVLLLITDGKPVKLEKLKKEVQLLKEKQVRIITMALGSTKRRIQRYKYIIRSIASGFKQSFNTEHVNLHRYVDRIAHEICNNRAPSPPETPQKKCFQEKKDIVFAVDGSTQVGEETFAKIISFVSKITYMLDITPSLIHVGFIQYSDARNTRIEFELNQYTNPLYVNQSLENIVFTNGKEADLMSALNIIDTQIFVGSGGDRISADDFLLLFVNGKVKNSNAVLTRVRKLKDKGVHVIVIGIGETNVEIADYYDKLASHPSDVTDFEKAELTHIVSDLVATTCRSVLCDPNVEKGKRECRQTKQDILFMIDSSRSMTNYFNKAKKFLSRVVGKLNLAATNTHVGLLNFAKKYNTEIVFKLGEYKFERDVTARISRAKQWGRYSAMSDIGYALRIVNKQIFNTSTGGHRVNASDLIFMATAGNTLYRPEVKRQVKLLKSKGVRIVVLNVDKTSARRLQNNIHDIASGPREVFPLDFKRLSTTTQDILDVQCMAEEAKVLPQCFDGNRKVLFMLDGSRGFRPGQIPKVLEFMTEIVKKLYAVPSNIAVGLLQYSDKKTAKRELEVKYRPLQETLDAIRNIRYQYGRSNLLGEALKYVSNEIFTDNIPRVKRVIILVTNNKPREPQKAYKFAEHLKRNGVELITIIIHIEKKSTNINKQYKALASSHASAHSLDYSRMLEHANDIMLNVCELHACPKDFTKDCTPKKQDIFMIIDSSRSIGKRTYPAVKRFVRRFVGNLDVSHDRTKVGILQASDLYKTQYEMRFSEYTDARDVGSIINEMDYHNGRASFIGYAIEKALADNLFNGSGNDRPDAENILMIFTDGVFHDERLARRLLFNLKQNGVRIVTVGLGERSRRPASKRLLESVVSSKSDVYLVSLTKDAFLIEAELNEVVRHVQTLECINKFEAPIRCSPETVDLFVVVDGSRSVGWENYGKVLEFLKKLASEFDIGKNKAHFGVLQYGTAEKTRVEFNLSAYDSNEKVTKAIANIEFLDSIATYTGHALSVVNEKIFNGKNGDRPNVPNMLIIFTDGSAHDIDTAYRNAAELKARGTRIIGIGAGRKVNNFFYQLEEMASRPTDAHKSEYDKLSGIVDDLLDVTCT